MATRTTRQRTAQRSEKHLALLFALAVTALLIVPVASSVVSADSARTGFLVIVNPRNPMTSTSTDFIAQVFFKRTTRWKDGEAIHPVDLLPNSATRRSFSDNILERSVAAVRNYWQQRLFSGRDLPPPELDSDDAVVRYVISSPGAIGYVSTAAKLDQAKVLIIE